MAGLDLAPRAADIGQQLLNGHGIGRLRQMVIEAGIERALLVTSWPASARCRDRWVVG